MTRSSRSAGVALALLLMTAAGVHAEILVRWDRDDIPPVEALGISTVAIPADRPAAVKRALSLGYRVFVEVSATMRAADVPGLRGAAGVVVTGGPSEAWLRALRQRVPPAVRVVPLDETAKWPHIRANWVTRNNEVLQVAGRSAQPWIENNAALLALARARPSSPPPMLTYRWAPVTVAEESEGPSLDSYLVAVAEAGSFGADLLLPLHERLQERLLLGQPDARAAWNELRRHLAFYSANLPSRYRPLANVGIVAADPLQSFEILNLLVRHNLPFRWIAPAALAGGPPDGVSLLIAQDPPDAPIRDALAAFARRGGTVVLIGGRPADPAAAGTGAAPGERWPGARVEHHAQDRASYHVGEGRIVEVLTGVADPNAFALEIRQHLGASRRVVDIWNGITVLVAPYEDPAGETLLVTAVNYAHQPLPVQLRVRGTFSVVRFESPDEEATLLAHRHRDGYTEFVIPALRVGGRVFLTERVDRGTGKPAR
jgi:hypothetical protein